MDTLGFSDSTNGFRINNDLVSIRSDPSFVNRLDPKSSSFSRCNYFIDSPLCSNNSEASNSVPTSGVSSEGDSPEEGDSCDAVLKCISQILMEEDLEGKTYMFHDCVALEAAEKSFYDVLGEKYPHSLHQAPCVDQYGANPEKNVMSNCNYNSSDDFAVVGNLVDLNCVNELGTSESSNIQTSFVNNTLLSISQSDSSSAGSGCDNVDFSLIDNTLLSTSSSLIGGQSIRQFRGGTKDASHFIINDNHAIFDLQNKISITVEASKNAAEAGLMAANNGSFYTQNGSRGRKNHLRGDGDYVEEERSNKHSALSAEEPEVTEMFDKVLLCNKETDESVVCPHEEVSLNGASRKLLQEGLSKTTRGKKIGNKKEVVDLTALLTHCAQAVASNDQRTARELLKQIRQHSSAYGDGSQRLAHCFANGLEARLAGSVGQIYAGYQSLVARRTSASDILKAYKGFVMACPFRKMAHILANRTIVKQVQKASRLHIIDFGILHGFQWPCLIQRLSARPGGPPKLHITGIELPQPGFRPLERVEDTGRRLADYCARFGVPFEYDAIAQKWENIRCEDFKIDKDELLVVNCIFRFRNLLDETVVVNSPRDSVLNLIRNMNPDLFIHGVVNGTYNAPFFVTRFKEALFHFSALFDMFEACVPSEDEARMLYETEIFGRDALNVIACEGSERIERPETYKQWQVRNLRAGFRQLPLHQDIVKKVRSMVKSDYHKDFAVDEDGQWMLQGWKGRILNALSCWKPA